MRKIIYFLAFVLILHSTLTIDYCFAQWEQTNGPGGTDLYSMYADGTNIWAGTGTSLYLTTNQGTIWNKRYNGIPLVFAPYPYSTARHGIFMLTGINSLGIFKSSNNGLNWYSASNGLVSNTTIRALTSINSVAIAGGVSGVYLSTNDGSNWIRPTSAYPNNINCAQISGGNVFLGSSIGLYRSTDNGFNWTILTTAPQSTIASITSAGNNIFIAANTGVYLSSNSGTNWILRNSGLPSSCTAILALGSNVFAGTNSNYLYKTTDNGLNWFSSSSGIYYPQIVSIVTDGSNLYAGSYYRAGVFISTNQGSNWREVNVGFPNIGVNALSITSNTIYAAATYAGIHKTTDNGNSWKILWPQLSYETYNSVASSGNYVLAGNSTAIFRSTDSGNNWTSILSTSCSSLAMSNNYAFAGTSNTIYRSTDNGATWITVFTPGSSVLSINIAGNNINAGLSGKIARSTDNGINWTILLTGSFTARNVIEMNPNLFAASSSGLLKSTDNGNSWFTSNNGLISTNVSSLTNYGQYLILTSDNVYYSSNFGNNWYTWGSGIVCSDGCIPRRLILKEPYVFMGTVDQSVWRRPLSELVGIQPISNIIPERFSLFQNYPNPFNPTTNVQFSIPYIQIVTLKVYDILGNEFSTLVNEQLKPGSYEVEFNGDSYASGVYYYKLIAGDYTETRKMVLIK